MAFVGLMTLKQQIVGSTIAALAGLYVEGKLHLLLGGDGKGADFSELADLINQPHIICYCFGRDGAQLAKLSSQSYLFDTVEQVIEFLRPTLQSGDMVYCRQLVQASISLPLLKSAVKNLLV